MARRAKQKFLGKKKVTGVIRASSVVRNPLCNKTDTEGNFFGFCLTVLLVFYPCWGRQLLKFITSAATVGFLSLRPHIADAIPSLESHGTGSSVSLLSLRAPEAANGAVAHSLPILDTLAGTHEGNNRPSVLFANNSMAGQRFIIPFITGFETRG